MPEPVLAALKLVFLAALYLFLARVLRAVWVEIFAERRSAAEAVHSGTVAHDAPVRRSSDPPEAPSAPTRSVETAKPGKARRRQKTLVLKIVEPPERLGTTFAIASEMTIGRAPGCAVPIDDSFASQLHARMFQREEATFVEDLGSTNGTTLNGKPVHGPIRVTKGDRIRIGDTVLELTT